jgi:tripartite-type tricarboxylate transporter receptor subunit TctC
MTARSVWVAGEADKFGAQSYPTKPVREATSKRILLTFGAAVFTLLPVPFATAQAYPAKPIRMLLPFPAGGPNDIFARVIAQKLSEAFDKQVVIDNRGGASGIIGVELAARAAPDGYTLLFGGAASLATTPALRVKLPYDPLKDFAPVSLVAIAPLMLVTHPQLPVKTVRDLIALAKAKPGQLNFASGGVGGLSHLAGELLKSMAGIDIVHVPYTGGGPSTIATVGGQVQLFFAGMASALPLVKEGKLNGIGVTSAKRTAAAPEFPTLAESGVPGYEIVTWFAIVAPAATPKPVIARLNAEIVKAVNAADTRKRFVELATDPASSTPEELAAYNRNELVKWKNVIKSAGIKPDES